MNTIAADSERPNRLGKWALVTAGAAAALCAGLALVVPKHFFAGYLVAAMAVWSLSIGSLTLVYLFALTGGAWGAAGRPWFEAAARVMPIVAVLFVPLAFGLGELYAWASPDFFAGLEHVQNRKWYLEENFYLWRSAGYFALWSAMSWLAVGLPFRHAEHSRRPRAVRGGQAVAGWGLVALLASVTWAVNDWVMSLDPFFASTLFGSMVGVGALMSAMAMVVAGTFLAPSVLGSRKDFSDKARSDLANLLLATVMLWAYFTFSQFLIMWSGNLPVEALWYQLRTAGGWRVATWVLFFGGLVIPLCCLASRTFKRSPHAVGWLAVALLAVRWLELCWLVLPHFDQLSWPGKLIAVPASLLTGSVALAAVSYDNRHCRLDHVEEEATSA